MHSVFQPKKSDEDTNNLLLFLVRNESSPLGISFIAVAFDSKCFGHKPFGLKSQTPKNLKELVVFGAHRLFTVGFSTLVRFFGTPTIFVTASATWGKFKLLRGARVGWRRKKNRKTFRGACENFVAWTNGQINFNSACNENDVQQLFKSFKVLKMLY